MPYPEFSEENNKPQEVPTSSGDREIEEELRSDSPGDMQAAARDYMNATAGSESVFDLSETGDDPLESANDTNKETQPPPLHDQLVQEVDADLPAAIRASVRRKEKVLETDTPSPLGNIIADKLAEAIAADDQAAAEEHYQTLLSLSTTPELMARSYLDATEIGIEEAADRLSLALLEEKVAGEISCEAKTQEGEQAYPSVIDDRLEAVVKACGEKGLPPDGWIAHYARDEDHKWELYMRHYFRMAEAAPPGSEPNIEAKEKLQAKASELLQTDIHSPGLIYKKTQKAISATEDPRLQQNLVDNFVETSKEIPLTHSNFYTLTAMGTEILKHPSLAIQENVEAFERTITACGNELSEQGHEDYMVAWGQSSWEVQLKRHYGASPQELADEIDLQTSRMLATDVPELFDPEDPYTFMRNQEYVCDRRDEMLGEHAEAYAKRGHYADAHVLLANIAISDNRGHYLQSCLDTALTLEEVQSIKPDETTLSVDPEIAQRFAIAEARIKGDTTTLEAIAFKNIRALYNGGSEKFKPKLELVKKSYEALIDREEDEALETARAFLRGLRGMGTPYHHLQYLSEDLIRSGDQAEATKAYHELNILTTDEEAWLYSVWRISQLLKEGKDRNKH